jgi:hypothetical protein
VYLASLSDISTIEFEFLGTPRPTSLFMMSKYSLSHFL